MTQDPTSTSNPLVLSEATLDRIEKWSASHPGQDVELDATTLKAFHLGVYANSSEDDSRAEKLIATLDQHLAWADAHPGEAIAIRPTTLGLCYLYVRPTGDGETA